MQKVVVDDLESLLHVLPSRIEDCLLGFKDLPGLLEVVLDRGRPPLARFLGQDVELEANEVTEDDIQRVVSRIGVFGDDNRAGIERTLHRISCIRSRTGKIVGLTLRVGRAVFGTIDVIDDLVFGGKNILLLGRPGVGKTTMLREIARVLADDARKRVVVVDTSNEIAGDGDIPHPAIGRSRRMQVKTPTLQHAVMIEAVENHMPQVIIIDEMGTELEAVAARTIAERGVQLVATAHGNALENLILNPTLSDLVGGIQAVTLGDEEARRRGTQKTVLERKAPPTFDIVVEILAWDRLAIHQDVASTVDHLLRGFAVAPEIRWIDAEGLVHKGQGESVVLTPPSLALGVDFGPFPPSQRYGRGRQAGGAAAPSGRPSTSALESSPEASSEFKSVKVYPFGVSRDRLGQALHALGVGVEVVETLREADIVLTTKTQYRRRPDLLRTAQEEGRPVYVLRRNTQGQIEQFAQGLSVTREDSQPRMVETALQEAEAAANQVTQGASSVELSPQSSYVRRLQHQLAERYNLASASTGREPRRRVIIYRP